MTKRSLLAKFWRTRASSGIDTAGLKGRVVSDEDATEEAVEETYLVPLIQNTVKERGTINVETTRKGRGGKRTFDAACLDVLQQGHDVRRLSPVWYSLKVDVPMIREILHVRRVGRILQNKKTGQNDEGKAGRRISSEPTYTEAREFAIAPCLPIVLCRGLTIELEDCGSFAADATLNEVEVVDGASGGSRLVGLAVGRIV